jgi:saccharopine dehydrogenase-like NADP-dependent oxidoreductase
MIRGTLRYPGWSETWAMIVKLGLPNESIPIPGLQERSYAEVVEMFLPLSVTGSSIEKRMARFLGISPTGRIMENLRWLGLFSTEKVRTEGSTAAAMLQELLERKLPLEPNARDLVILQHVLDVRWPAENGRRERQVATMVEYGEPRGMTAMARTVGMPAAIGVKRILSGELTQTGCQIPSHPAIYQPILEELEREGVRFTERSMDVPRPE